MKTTLIFSVLFISFLLVGCGIGSSGPSDGEVKEMVANALANGLDAFCPGAEVESVEIDERGNPQEIRDRVYYPIKTVSVVQCGRSMLSEGGEKTKREEYTFWKNEYDEWNFEKTSL